MKQKKMTTSLEKCTYSELLRLPRDNYDGGDFSISTDASTVWLSEQAMGHPAKQTFAIPRWIFNRLIASYKRPQKLKRGE